MTTNYDFMHKINEQSALLIKELETYADYLRNAISYEEYMESAYEHQHYMNMGYEDFEASDFTSDYLEQKPYEPSAYEIELAKVSQLITTLKQLTLAE